MEAGACGDRPERVDEEIVIPSSPEFGDYTCVLKRSSWITSEGVVEKVKFFRFCEAPRIRNLVFSGSLRDRIESVSGSSAGAITAAFVAVGVPAAEIAAESRTMQLTQLLDSSKSWIPKITGKSGIPLYEWIREKLTDLFVSMFSHTGDQTLRGWFAFRIIAQGTVFIPESRLLI